MNRPETEGLIPRTELSQTSEESEIRVCHEQGPGPARSLRALRQTALLNCLIWRLVFLTSFRYHLVLIVYICFPYNVSRIKATTVTNYTGGEICWTETAWSNSNIWQHCCVKMWAWRDRMQRLALYATSAFITRVNLLLLLLLLNWNVIWICNEIYWNKGSRNTLIHSLRAI
jgi:hypothetical protein